MPMQKTARKPAKRGGVVIENPATARSVSPVIRQHLPPPDWPHLHRALHDPILCVQQPGYRRDREASYQIDVPTTITADKTGDQAPLFLWMNYCKFRLIQTLRELEDRPLSTAACRILIRWQREASRVRDYLIRFNLPLVKRYATSKAYNRTYIDYEAEGRIGLIHAVDRFDAGRGTQFATYAVYAIFRAAHRVQYQETRQHQVPKQIARSGRWKGPLDNTAEARLDLRTLERLLESDSLLTGRVRKSMIRRFGLFGTKAETLSEASAVLGVSRETVRSDTRKGVDILRNAMLGTA